VTGCHLVIPSDLGHTEGGHLSEKNWNVREFDICQGKEILKEKNLVKENCFLLTYLHGSTPVFITIVLA